MITEEDLKQFLVLNYLPPDLDVVEAAQQFKKHDLLNNNSIKLIFQRTIEVYNQAPGLESILAYRMIFRRLLEVDREKIMRWGMDSPMLTRFHTQNSHLLRQIMDIPP